MAVFLPGIGTVAAGALFGAGMGAISASVAGAVSDYSSGNVRSLGEATKDMVISMITGAITGAIGAAFPAVKWFGDFTGLIYRTEMEQDAVLPLFSVPARKIEISPVPQIFIWFKLTSDS